MQTISTSDISTSDYVAGRPLAVWRDLPDPRAPAAGVKVSIVVNAGAWEEHVVGRHIVNRREPWDGALEPATAETLRQAHAAGTAVPPQVRRQALEWLELEIRRSLERPLAMLYEVHPPDSPDERVPHVWLLLLPCGATAYVHQARWRQGGWRQGGGGGYLATCYFPRVAAVEPNGERRWTRVLRDLVGRYGILDACRGLLPPGPQHEVRVMEDGVVREVRSAIQFVNLASWGFRAELTGSPWRGRLAPWTPSSPPAGPPRGPRPHRTKPRRRIWEDDDDA